VKVDADVTWRLMYRLDPDAVLIGEIFAKKSRTTPKAVIDTCKMRFKQYNEISK
jgi:phage-related protein